MLFISEKIGSNFSSHRQQILLSPIETLTGKQSSPFQTVSQMQVKVETILNYLWVL